MKSLTLALASGMLAVAMPAAASGLAIETSAINREDQAGTMRVTATVSWRNSWRTDRNHDAVWLFAKAQPRPGTGWHHLRLAAIRPAEGAPVTCAISKDGIGAFCSPSDEHRGHINTLPPGYTFFRAPFAGVGYYDHRGTIRLDEDGFVAGAPQRPANWISWDDGTAFADWAGLRPMTELEFTKAARGPVTPAGIDYPWGSFTRSRLKRKLQPSGDLLTSGDANEALLRDDTRDVLGASYYWVMDLAGSVWERVVSAGHPAGRAFRGTHGDGRLRAYGMATNDDWPSGDHDGGGYGYKGGGYYEMSRELARMDEELLLELNPHSPIDWRNYAAWGGAPRSVAYGFRAARTADE